MNFDLISRSNKHPRSLHGLITVCLWTGCAPNKTTTDADSATTDVTGTNASAPSETNVPTGTEATEDFFEMQSCQLNMVCEEFIHHLNDGEPYHLDMSTGYLDVEKCILTGLRDGTVGRYIYGFQFDDSNLQLAIIHVHAERAVTFAVHSQGHVLDQNGTHYEDVYLPAQTCALLAPAYFEDCLSNHNDNSHYVECMQTWWSDCSNSGARCE